MNEKNKTFDDLDLESIYQDALTACSIEHNGYRLNFGVYFTPKY